MTFLPLAAAILGVSCPPESGSEGPLAAQVEATYRHARAGLYRTALKHIDAMLALRPGDTGAREGRVLYAALAGHRDQSVARLRHTRLRFDTRNGNRTIPVSVNGKPARFFFDTGASLSLISEQEARRLGMEIAAVGPDGPKMGVMTGDKVAFRLAWARRLAIGGIELRNVAFTVFGDDQLPFNELPLGERGGVGIPVLLALETIRWQADGTFQAGFPGAAYDAGRANLCMDGNNPRVVAMTEGRLVRFHLDTGAQSTDFYVRFADDFAPMLGERGRPGTREIGGVGSRKTFPTIDLPALVLAVGGFESTLRPVRVLREKTLAESTRVHGNLGWDVLSQARRVSLDFRAMTLQME